MEHIEETAADIERTVAGRTLLDVFADNARRFAGAPALRWRSGGRWASLNWREYREQVEHATLGLREIGVRPGDRVGILVSNRPELAVADLALLHARAVPVCLFDSFTAEQLGWVLRSLDCRLVIVEDAAGRDRLAGMAARTVMVDAGPDGQSGAGPDDQSWERVMTLGRERAARRDGDFDRCWRAARPADLVSINYTSGTTGSLKGVRHSHANVLWHAESFARFLPVPPGTRFLAYLPRAHATERFVTTWFPLARAGTVHLCPDPARLPEYLTDVRPQFFGGVLQVWEKMYAAVASTVDVDAADAAGRAAARAGLGLDECAFAFSGGGALAPSVQEFFNAIGVPLTEGWGQSELVSAATCAPPGRIRAGTVGSALPGVAVRAAADGELLVRSGSRMVGYTADVSGGGFVDGDGWVHTGDLGEIDADGYVRVLGRREEVFRLADGYPVPVTRVESQLRANPLVDHACVVGEGQPDLRAVLVVSAPPDRWRREDVDRIVRESNRLLPDRQRIAAFAVLTGQWDRGRADELTHTGKLRRGVIAAKHAELIRSLRA
ncbi:MAG: long-chain acyl-CoA synthetase [Micromonosporaceae bacterium]